MGDAVFLFGFFVVIFFWGGGGGYEVQALWVAQHYSNCLFSESLAVFMQYVCVSA